MGGPSKIVLHVVPASHPCLAVSTALSRYELDFETEMMASGEHGDKIEEIYGEGRRTVPGLLIDGEPVHGSAPIFSQLDEMLETADFYPDAQAARIREVEAGLAEDLQVTGRVLTFGALHFRPESLGSFGGAGQLDPAGVDFAIKMVRGAWRYIGISAERLHETLAGLPGLIDDVDSLVEEGAMGGDEPTAIDFQIGSSLHLLMQLGDIRPLLQGRPAGRVVTDWFEPGSGDVPAGAFPAGWVPTA